MQKNEISSRRETEVIQHPAKIVLSVRIQLNVKKLHFLKKLTISIETKVCLLCRCNEIIVVNVINVFSHRALLITSHVTPK